MNNPFRVRRETTRYYLRLLYLSDFSWKRETLGRAQRPLIQANVFFGSQSRLKVLSVTVDRLAPTRFTVYNSIFLTVTEIEIEDRGTRSESRSRPINRVCYSTPASRCLCSCLPRFDDKRENLEIPIREERIHEVKCV